MSEILAVIRVVENYNCRHKSIITPLTKFFDLTPQDVFQSMGGKSSSLRSAIVTPELPNSSK